MNVKKITINMIHSGLKRVLCIYTAYKNVTLLNKHTPNFKAPMQMLHRRLDLHRHSFYIFSHFFIPVAADRHFFAYMVRIYNAILETKLGVLDYTILRTYVLSHRFSKFTRRYSEYFHSSARINQNISQ